MIKHIVFFTMKKGQEWAMATMMEKLRHLPKEIDFIRSFEVGQNIVIREANADVALVSTFDSVEDLMLYKSHPAHEAFVEYMITVCEPVRAVDFTI